MNSIIQIDRNFKDPGKRPYQNPYSRTEEKKIMHPIERLRSEGYGRVQGRRRPWLMLWGRACRRSGGGRGGGALDSGLPWRSRRRIRRKGEEAPATMCGVGFGLFAARFAGEENGEREMKRLIYKGKWQWA